MITPILVWTVGVVENDDIEAQIQAMKVLPGLLWQHGCVGAIEHTAPLALHRVKQQLNSWIMIRREGRNPILTDGKELQCFNLMEL